MENIYLAPEIEVTDVNVDVKKWLSNLEFIYHEIDFFSKNLLDSYIFDPYTQELFDRKCYLKDNLNEIKPRVSNFIKKIRLHGNEMSGILECQDSTECDLAYRTKHQEERFELKQFLTQYRDLKRDSISYASEILRYRKK